MSVLLSPIDNSKIEANYKLEQQQRALEREVRKAKRKVEGLSDPENIKKAKAELRQAQKNLKDFIDKVNADEGETILKRDYGREKVYSDIPKNRIDNSGGSDIIITGGKISDSNFTKSEIYEKQAEDFYAARIKNNDDVEIISKIQVLVKKK